MNDLDIKLIRNYIDESLDTAGLNTDSDEFMKRSYSEWAAYEILNLIMDSPMESTTLILDRFQLKMLVYSKLSEESKKRLIFEQAWITAREILLLFV